MNLIYFDNGASSHPKPINVYQNTFKYVVSNGANAGRSSHTLAMEAAEKVYQTRQKIADFFNVKSSENIVFTMNSTHALNTVLFGLLKKGDHVITTNLEHNSVLRPLYALQKRGVKVDVVDVDLYDDDVTLQRIKQLICSDTKALIVTQCSNVCGKMLPIQKIAQLKNTGMHLIVDGSQGAGSIPTDFEGCNIDYYCAPSHKGMLGIQGAGFVICRHNELEPLLFGGTGGDSESHHQPDYLPERLEAGTLPIPAICSIAEGIDFLDKIGVENLFVHKKHLVKSLYRGLKKNPVIEVGVDYEKMDSPGVLSFNVKGRESEEVAMILAQNGIAVRSGIHCAPLFHQKMKTLNRGMVRVTFGFSNTQEEIKRLLEVLKFLKN